MERNNKIVETVMSCNDPHRSELTLFDNGQVLVECLNPLGWFVCDINDLRQLVTAHGRRQHGERVELRQKLNRADHQLVDIFRGKRAPVECRDKPFSRDELPARPTASIDEEL